MDDEHFFRLPESALYGCWIVDERFVNLNDLEHPGPGRIIRVRGENAIQYIPAPLEPYEHIAGMISDAA